MWLRERSKKEKEQEINWLEQKTPVDKLPKHFKSRALAAKRKLKKEAEKIGINAPIVFFDQNCHMRVIIGQSLVTNQKAVFHHFETSTNPLKKEAIQMICKLNEWNAKCTGQEPNYLVVVETQNGNLNLHLSDFAKKKEYRLNDEDALSSSDLKEIIDFLKKEDPNLAKEITMLNMFQREKASKRAIEAYHDITTGRFLMVCPFAAILEQEVKRMIQVAKEIYEN